MATVFFISGHGFGHASRDVEVINRLPVTGRPVIIRSAVNPGLLARTLRVPYELRPGICDTGLVQTSSVAQDDRATVDRALEFYADFEARIDAEAAALADDDVDLIVGDIPPLAFDTAARLGVPSVAMGNFTWDWVYDAHPDFRERAGWVIDRIRTAYRQATRAIDLSLSGGFEIFPRVDRVPLIARHPTQDRIRTREHFGVATDRKIALLSFGGYGLPALDLGQIDCGPEWTILTTDRLQAPRPTPPPDVRVIEEQAFLGSVFRYEDLVAAADVVISKPGYGIIGECVAAGTPLLYTSRGHFREYDLLVREMPRMLRCRFIDQADLFAGRWQSAIDLLCRQPDPPERVATSGAEVVTSLLDEVRHATRAATRPR